MAINFTGKNLTIWKVDITTTKNGKEYARLQCSSQKKNKQTNAYETDWSGVVDFWGSAYDKFKEANLQVRDRINILSGSHTNTYDKVHKKTYENYNVWSAEDFEIAGQFGEQPAKPKEEPAVMQPIDDDEELPF